MANPTTNFGWVMPTSTSLVTNLPADFNTFGQGVDTSMAQLKGGTTGQVLSKTSGTDMAFTWVTPTDQTPLTTKGDLFAFSTVDARLAVGANETRLVADSTQTVGLKYVADTTNYAINAKADLLVGTAADTLAALTVGTNGQVLTADSTVSPTGLKWATPAGGGKFGQIVQATYSTQTAITSTSYVTTGINASITPTATSSKVLIQATIPFNAPTAGLMSFTIFRGTVSGTNLASDMLGQAYDISSRTVTIMFLDSPATASAQTYTIGTKVSTGTGYSTHSPSTGVLTLTEVTA